MPGLLSLHQPNQTKPNQTKPNQTMKTNHNENVTLPSVTDVHRAVNPLPSRHVALVLAMLNALRHLGEIEKITGDYSEKLRVSGYARLRDNGERFANVRIRYVGQVMGHAELDSDTPQDRATNAELLQALDEALNKIRQRS
jgi:hypothetical protein